MISFNSIDTQTDADVDPKDITHWVPTVLYAVLALGTLGLAAFTASSNMIADQPNTDIWQHVAAVRALMENLASPENPFVVSAEPSRHFHALWVATAAVARVFDLGVWQAIAGATFVVTAVLAFGIHYFARAFFGSPWAPAVLLALMLFGWAGAFAHTGLHSFWTLLYGAAYPATLMIGLSLLLWGVVIRSLADSRYLLAVAFLSGLMLATHQLGAVIGFVGAVSFAAGQPDARPKDRLRVLAAMIVGIALALAWPFYNPVEMMLRGGNSSWDGGPDFYSFPWFPGILVPAALGIFWLHQRQARALVLALVAFSIPALFGFIGVQIGARFLMPIVLILHIGLAGFILDLMSRSVPKRPILRQSIPWLAAAIVVSLAILGRSAYQSGFAEDYAAAPDIYAAAEQLTADLADNEEIAAAGLAAWPVVATGQRVLSVPWPEPGIADLAERQKKTKVLFDPALPPEARLFMAKELGIRVLIADRRLVSPALLEVLSEEAIATSGQSSLLRFDLWE